MVPPVAGIKGYTDPLSHIKHAFTKSQELVCLSTQIQLRDIKAFWILSKSKQILLRVDNMIYLSDIT